MHAGYETPRDFPVNVTTPLNVSINYEATATEGRASETCILGFIRLGSSTFAYADSSSVGLLGGVFGGGDSVESAAVADALERKGADVLGFPLFRKKVSNYFLWKTRAIFH